MTAAPRSLGHRDGVNSEDLSSDLDLGASYTDVAGGTANWAFTDTTGNYNDASGSVDIVINKADRTIDVTGWTGAYDGSAHGASGTATGVNSEDLSSDLDLGAWYTDVPDEPLFDRAPVRAPDGTLRAWNRCASPRWSSSWRRLPSPGPQPAPGKAPRRIAPVAQLVAAIAVAGLGAVIVLGGLLNLATPGSTHAPSASAAASLRPRPGPRPRPRPPPRRFRPAIPCWSGRGTSPAATAPTTRQRPP